MGATTNATQKFAHSETWYAKYAPSIEARMREIEHAHHRKDERQSSRQHEQQEPIAHPVQHRHDENSKLSPRAVGPF